MLPWIAVTLSELQLLRASAVERYLAAHAAYYKAKEELDAACIERDSLSQLLTHFQEQFDAPQEGGAS